MDPKDVQLAGLKKEVTPYLNHLDSTLEEPKVKPVEVKISHDGVSEGQQILNNQEYAFQKPLRTFEGDVADALKSQNASLATISIAEKVKKEKIEQIAQAHPMAEVATESHKTKNALFVLLSILLVGGGLYLLYTFYYLPQKGTAPSVRLTVPAIINPDVQKEFNIPSLADDKKTFTQYLRAEIDKAAPAPNTLVHLYITEGTETNKKLINSSQFLTLLKVNASDQYLRTLEPDLMFGIHGFNGNNPFIILKTRVYQTAFAGMLKWEETLNDDLTPLFSKGGPAEPQAPAESTADILASNKPFVDLVIKNKDVRVLTNKYDRIVLLYTFLDKETILITTNEFTLKEIIDRMTNRRFVR